MITSSNVRFLAKEPIVGLKIFDGEKLRKRLQITFTSEGNFNMFANKIQQWLGLPVVANYEAPDSQVAYSQQATQGPQLSQTQAASSSQIPCEQNGLFSEHGSQSIGTRSVCSNNINSHLFNSQNAHPEPSISQPPRSHESTQQSESTQPTPSKCQSVPQVSFSQPQMKSEMGSNSFDAFSLLLNAAATDGGAPPLSQYDTSALSQSTQIWNDDSKYGMFQYSNPTGDNTTYSQTTAGHSLTQALRKIPFDSGQKKRKSNSSRTKRKHSMDELLESAISRILEQKQESYLNLNDEDLSLKICRRLKSKSFLMLLKRVESLLD
ncbi:hypothetical protein OXX80_004408 [Metschnikowia pulcherrima]